MRCELIMTPPLPDATPAMSAPPYSPHGAIGQPIHYSPKGPPRSYQPPSFNSPSTHYPSQPKTPGSVDISSIIANTNWGSFSPQPPGQDRWSQPPNPIEDPGVIGDAGVGVIGDRAKPPSLSVSGRSHDNLALPMSRSGSNDLFNQAQASPSQRMPLYPLPQSPATAFQPLFQSHTAQSSPRAPTHRLHPVESRSSVLRSQSPSGRIAAEQVADHVHALGGLMGTLVSEAKEVEELRAEVQRLKRDCEALRLAKEHSVGYSGGARFKLTVPGWVVQRRTRRRGGDAGRSS